MNTYEELLDNESCAEEDNNMWSDKISLEDRFRATCH
jgi:hypothetical protein